MSEIIKTGKGPVEYRLEGKSNKTALTFHGAQVNCDLFTGEDFFLENGYQVLIPSRAGYGKTDLSTGKSAEDFADTVIELLDHLGIYTVTVMGFSAGGRLALQFAGKYPDRTEKVILQSALTHEDWPKPKIRLLSSLLFNSYIEKYIWIIMRKKFEKKPLAALKLMLRSLSNLPAQQVIEQITPEHKQSLIDYLKNLKSDKGFINDLHYTSGDLSRITAPTLIIHSKYDGSVDLSHPEYGKKNIKNCEIYLTEAENHLIWFSKHYDAIKKRMVQFLNS